MVGVLAAGLVVAVCVAGVAVALGTGVAVACGAVASATGSPGPVVAVPLRARDRARAGPSSPVAPAASVRQRGPLAAGRRRLEPLLGRVCEHRGAGGRRCDDGTRHDEQAVCRCAPKGPAPSTRRGHRASKSVSRHRSARYLTG